MEIVFGLVNANGLLKRGNLHLDWRSLDGSQKNRTYKSRLEILHACIIEAVNVLLHGSLQN